MASVIRSVKGKEKTKSARGGVILEMWCEQKVKRCKRRSRRRQVWRLLPLRLWVLPVPVLRQRTWDNERKQKMRNSVQRVANEWQRWWYCDQMGKVRLDFRWWDCNYAANRNLFLHELEEQTTYWLKFKKKKKISVEPALWSVLLISWKHFLTGSDRRRRHVGFYLVSPWISRWLKYSCRHSGPAFVTFTGQKVLSLV